MEIVGEENLSTWIEKWETGNWFPTSPKKVVNENLIKYAEKITRGKKICRIFVPLCGKTADMRWLWEQGHFVVGVEISRKAITEFFLDQSIDYSVSDIPTVMNGKLYQSKDLRITIYQCDLFVLNSEHLGMFDAVWDCGSMVAINPSERIRYAKLIKSLLLRDGRILLESYLFDPTGYARKSRAPFCLPVSQVQTLFGSDCVVELLCTKDALNDHYKQQGLKSLEIAMILVCFNSIM